jgi:hypothetical protein
MKKAFAQMKETTEESDLSDSSPSEGASHFQFQFALTETEFEPQMHSPTLTLDLRKVILLDSQSTMDLICNRALVTKISKST